MQSGKQFVSLDTDDDQLRQTPQKSSEWNLISKVLWYCPWSILGLWLNSKLCVSLSEGWWGMQFVLFFLFIRRLFCILFSFFVIFIISVSIPQPAWRSIQSTYSTTSLMCYSFQDVDPESLLHFILVCPNAFEAPLQLTLMWSPLAGIHK